jgi:glycogen(starch) synthase
MSAPVSFPRRSRVTQLLFTGDRLFLSRHRLLLDAIERRGYAVASLAQDERSIGARARYAVAAAAFAARAVALPSPLSRAERTNLRALKVAFDRSPHAFARTSRDLATAIDRRADRPNGIVHVFGLSSPDENVRQIPYAHYLDYTYALASRAGILQGVTAHDRERFMQRERRAYEGARRIFTMSRLVRESVVTDYGIPEERVDVVGAGPNLSLDTEIPKSFERRRLLFNASEFERKGGPLALAAFAIVRATDPRASLVVVGGIVPEAYARADGVEQYGRVSADRMRELYATSSVLLAPATNDPFPGAVIEAMAHGTPAIVRDRDGMPEIVRNDHDGIVLSDADARPDGLARTIVALFDDAARERRLSENARATIAERLNWNVVAEKMEPFFRSL